MTTRKKNYVKKKCLLTYNDPPLIEASKHYTMLSRESSGHKIELKTKYFQPHCTEKINGSCPRNSLKI